MKDNETKDVNSELHDNTNIQGKYINTEYDPFLEKNKIVLIEALNSDAHIKETYIHEDVNEYGRPKQTKRLVMHVFTVEFFQNASVDDSREALIVSINSRGDGDRGRLETFMTGEALFINIDGENIANKLVSQKNERLFNKNKEGVGMKSSNKFEISNYEDFNKIVNAENLEVRYQTKEHKINLENRVETMLHRNFKILYNQVIDESMFAELLPSDEYLEKIKNIKNSVVEESFDKKFECGWFCYALIAFFLVLLFS